MRTDNYNTGIRGLIFKTLLSVGAFPYSATGIIDDFTYRSFVNKAQEMIREGVVKGSWMPDGGKSRRRFLTLVGDFQNNIKNKAMLSNIADFSYLYNHYNNHITDQKNEIIKKKKDVMTSTRREKVYRRAESFLMFYAVGGIGIFLNDHPPLVKVKDDVDTQPCSIPLYYTRSELQSGTEFEVQVQDNKNRFITGQEVNTSRCNGVFVTQNKGYLVYHTGFTTMIWNNYGEMHMMNEASLCLKRTFGSECSVNDAILFYYDPAVVKNILLDVPDKSENRTTIDAGNRFNELIAIPYNEHGRNLLRQMKNPLWKKILHEKYLPDCNRYASKNGISCDGISKDGAYTLLLIACDINKTSKFLMDTKQLPDNKYRIICRKYQKPITEVFGDNVEIICVPDEL